VGLVRSLAVTCCISMYCPLQLNWFSLVKKGNGSAIVIGNGDILFDDVINADDVYRDLIRRRRAGEVPQGVSIKRTDEGIEVMTTEGRFIRPLYYNKEKQIEYVDVSESENLLIATDFKDKKEWTHVEIDPSFFLGISASTTPFPEYNQGPRITYSAGMCKQAIGTFERRRTMDKSMMELQYPQKALCTTKVSDHLVPT
jgi:DNA-directed RNA polymerase beta subunit